MYVEYVAITNSRKNKRLSKEGNEVTLPSTRVDGVETGCCKH